MAQNQINWVAQNQINNQTATSSGWIKSIQHPPRQHPQVGLNLIPPPRCTHSHHPFVSAHCHSYTCKRGRRSICPGILHEHGGPAVTSRARRSRCHIAPSIKAAGHVRQRYHPQDNTRHERDIVFSRLLVTYCCFTHSQRPRFPQGEPRLHGLCT